MITITKQLLESQSWLNKDRNDRLKHTYFHNGHLHVRINDEGSIKVDVYKGKEWVEVPFAKTLSDLFTLHKLFNGQDFIETEIRLSSGVLDVNGRMIMEDQFIKVFSCNGCELEDGCYLVQFKNGAFITVNNSLGNTTLYNWLEMGCSFKIVEG